MLFTRNGESGLATSVKATLVIDKSEVIIYPGSLREVLDWRFSEHRHVSNKIRILRVTLLRILTIVWG